MFVCSMPLPKLQSNPFCITPSPLASPNKHVLKLIVWCSIHLFFLVCLLMLLFQESGEGRNCPLNQGTPRKVRPWKISTEKLSVRHWLHMGWVIHSFLGRPLEFITQTIGTHPVWLCFVQIGSIPFHKSSFKRDRSHLNESLRFGLNPFMHIYIYIYT